MIITSKQNFEHDTGKVLLMSPKNLFKEIHKKNNGLLLLLFFPVLRVAKNIISPKGSTYLKENYQRPTYGLHYSH